MHFLNQRTENTEIAKNGLRGLDFLVYIVVKLKYMGFSLLHDSLLILLNKSCLKCKGRFDR